MSNDNVAENPLDLQGLVRLRESVPQNSLPSQSWASGLARRAFPIFVLCGFISLLVWTTREQWLPRTEVTVISVVTTSLQQQQAGTPLFQAAGWIEPSPSPVKATALADGVVSEVLVVAGQAVTAGQPVAKLLAVDAQLALRRALAIRDLRQAELEQAAATAIAAAERLKYPVHLAAEVAQSEAALARSEIEAAKLPYLIQTAQSQLSFAEKLWNNRQGAQDSLAGRLVDEARNQREAAVANLEELQQREQRLEVEQTALRAHVSAVQQQLTLCVSERQAVAESNANAAAARARLTEAELAVEHAALVVERMIVRAPITGRILERLAAPGSSLMGIDSGGGHQSTAVATLYDPAALQVRADVRLEDFAKVLPDQEVRIETASCSEPLRGRVLLSTSTANIQKNTVEVKVAILDPPDVLRPEMLVTTTFLAPQSKATENTPIIVNRVLIPQNLVTDLEGQPMVWVVTPAQLAELRTVQLGRKQGEDLVEVVAGLTATDKLIVDGRQLVSTGKRVNARPAESPLRP